MKEKHMPKVLFVATVQSHIAQFHVPIIQMLQGQGYEVHVAARDNLSEKAGRNIDIVDAVHDIPFSRSPYSKHNFKSYRLLKTLIQKEQYDIVHCNTPVGGILSRLACRKLRKRGLKVIYTAHGFHFYKGASLLNWLLYYPLEKLCSYLTDVLITINKEDYNYAKDHMHAQQTCYVPGVGVDVTKFSNPLVDKETLLSNFGIDKGSTIILSVGELNENKNHATVIRALGELQDHNIHYIIAGNGPLKDNLQELGKELKLNLHLVGYQSDIASFYHAADLFILPSLREGLPLAVMEAMVSGLPCAVSQIRGCVDLIDAQGGKVFNPHSVKSCKSAIMETLAENKNEMGRYNQHKVEGFSLKVVQEKIQSIYHSL